MDLDLSDEHRSRPAGRWSSRRRFLHGRWSRFDEYTRDGREVRPVPGTDTVTFADADAVSIAVSFAIANTDAVANTVPDTNANADTRANSDTHANTVATGWPTDGQGPMQKRRLANFQHAARVQQSGRLHSVRQYG